jgi:hypothetical protein
MSGAMMNMRKKLNPEMTHVIYFLNENHRTIHPTPVILTTKVHSFSKERRIW